MACQLRDHIAAKSGISPFIALGYLNDQALLRQCAENFVKNKIGNFPFPLWQGEVWRNDRIKIAYLSADFRQHAVAYLMAELLERHDRGRFEIIGLSFGPDDRSEMRARLVAAFDQFLDVRAKSDAEVARLLCRTQGRYCDRPSRLHAGLPPSHPGASPSTDPSQLSGISRDDGGRLHRLHHRR